MVVAAAAAAATGAVAMVGEALREPAHRLAVLLPNLMALLENRLQRTPASHQVCSTGATVRSHGQDARRACLARLGKDRPGEKTEEGGGGQTTKGNQPLNHNGTFGNIGCPVSIKAAPIERLNAKW